MKIITTFLILSLALAGYPAKSFAEEPVEAPASPFSLNKKFEKKRNVIWPPLVSFLLPGFDQYFEQQYGWAVGYSGAAAVGYGYAVGANEYLKEDPRHVGLGLQIFGAAGGFSAYHSFRTAVRSRQPHGEFDFLKVEETPQELLTAPFRFEYLGRWTTIIPLTIAAGLVFLAPTLMGEPESYDKFTFADGFFSLSTSYLAGTWEEAAFRGWLQPMGRHYLGSTLWSNVLTSALFAAGHYQGNHIPWPQFLFGLYAGAVAARNDWAISEGIFFHTWWDVIILSAYYSTTEKKTVVIFPAVNMAF